MPEEIKNLNKEVDKLEAAAKKYASKDTVVSIGGYEFTPAKLMIAFTIVSSIIGSLYGSFEVYKDYIGMKKKIAEYVSPDLSNFDKRLAIIEQNQNDTNTTLKDSAAKTADYTRDIKNDLKNDIRKVESVSEQIERSVKQTQREIEQEMRVARRDIREDLEKTRIELAAIRKEIADSRRETRAEIEVVKKEIDNKIQKALDNPLANK